VDIPRDLARCCTPPPDQSGRPADQQSAIHRGLYDLRTTVGGSNLAPVGRVQPSGSCAAVRLLNSVCVPGDRMPSTQLAHDEPCHRRRQDAEVTGPVLGERAGVALGKKDDLYGADVVGAGHVHGEHGFGLPVVSYCRAWVHGVEGSGTPDSTERLPWCQGCTPGTPSLTARFENDDPIALALARDGLDHAPATGTSRPRLLAGVAHGAANRGDRGSRVGEIGAFRTVPRFAGSATADGARVVTISRPISGGSSAEGRRWRHPFVVRPGPAPVPARQCARRSAVAPACR